MSEQQNTATEPRNDGDGHEKESVVQQYYEKISRGDWKKDANYVPFILLFAIIFSLILFGRLSCFRDEASKHEQSAVLQDFYREMPLTKKSNNLDLVAELAAIADEGFAPETLEAYPETTLHENLAALLAERFSFDAIEMRDRLTTIARRVPAEKWQVDSVKIANANTIISVTNPEIEEIRALLRKNDSTIVFIPPMIKTPELGPEMTEGVLASFQVYPLMEEFKAAEALAKEKLSQATDSVVYILRFSRFCSQFGNMDTRIVASYARERAFEIFQTLVWDPDFTQAEAEKILEELRETLQTWPNDSRALNGDRLSAFRFYETARKGGLGKVLTGEEFDKLQEMGFEKILFKSNVKDAEMFDADELFYLKAMRALIESCQQPYFERNAVFEQIAAEINSKLQLPDYPVLAAFQLESERPALRELSHDRARCESWALALGLALEKPVSGIRSDPVIGRQYQLEREPSGHRPGKPAVTVTRPSDNQKIEVPAWDEVSG